MHSHPATIVAFVDIPDPDNYLMLIALVVLAKAADLHIVVTGRPVHPDPDPECAKWDWDDSYSRDVLKVNIGRTRNILQKFGVNPPIYDGGIAPRTPVPHWVHFEEYYRMADIDPVRALHQSQMLPISALIKHLLTCPDQSVAVVVGGPMTGLAELLIRHPDVAGKIREVHAMFGTWGDVELMGFDDVDRGKKQFNVVCDPQAAHQVLMGLTCPIYLLPTEVTRVDDIGFWDMETLAAALPQTKRAQAVLSLYELWYRYVVAPQRRRRPTEKIFIHDLSSALSLIPELREAIYQFEPVHIDHVPHWSSEAERWGEIDFTRTDLSTNHFAARTLTPEGPTCYRQALHDLFV